MKIINISAYKFIDLDNLDQLKNEFEQKCNSLGLKGTILLGSEGVNLMLAGSRAGIDSFAEHLAADERFADIAFKESISSYVPFSKLKVRIKDEIVAMRIADVRPLEETATHLSAQEVKRRLDEGWDVTILDTRNQFEVDMGTFKNAVDLHIDSFRQLPEAAEQQLDPSLKDKPLLMFCTGGIRCEKASVALMRQGFKEVYQLDGGIIKYFEECGGAHWQGDCVVFDDRIALTPDLQPIDRESM